MKRIFTILTALVMVFWLTVSAHALLIDNGDGTITDDDTGLMWLQDANLAASNTFGVSGSGIRPEGFMTWDKANSWIAGMNTASYLGYTDWRLPTADPSCSLTFNCTGSEMGHLFYSELSGTAGSSILTSGDPDLALFSNIQTGEYWSGTEYAPKPTSSVWVFNFGGAGGAAGGGQFVGGKGNGYFVWAVRDGDVGATSSAPVPEPSTWLLMGTGLAGLGIARFRKKKA